MNTETLSFELRSDYIELYKLLKLESLVSSGGEAKLAISNGYVFLNGKREIQKRKKIRKDDKVVFNNTTIIID
jgi:ribosome-associated protein